MAPQARAKLPPELGGLTRKDMETVIYQANLGRENAQIAQLYGITVSNLIGEEEPPKKSNPHFHIYVVLLSVALARMKAASGNLPS